MEKLSDRAELEILHEYLPLNALKERRHHKYLSKENIPTYPRPELHVANVSHSTDLRGLQGIKADGAFKSPKGSKGLVWFSLTVSPEELRDAETREMMLVRPGGKEKRFIPQGGPKGEPQGGPKGGPKGEPQGGPKGGPKGEPQGGPKGGPKGEPQGGPKAGPMVLEAGSLLKFASSPAFKSGSKYGSFRFTFSLRNVLDKYKQQFCGGQEPVFRVHSTALFRKEVLYTVLVHSPDDHEMFSQFPLLEETPNCICAFEAGSTFFTWKPQAMCKEHRFELVVQELMIDIHDRHDEEFYVWDCVALALHVSDKLLKFDDLKLRENLKFCGDDYPPVRPEIQYQIFEEAEAEVKKLWPDQEHLQKFSKSQFHITE